MEDHFNKIYIGHFNVSGKINKDGRIRQMLKWKIDLKPHVRYDLLLSDMKYSAFFYNGDDTWNKLFYCISNTLYEITLPNGLNKVDNYSSVIEQRIFSTHYLKETSIKLTSD